MDRRYMSSMQKKVSGEPLSRRLNGANLITLFDLSFFIWYFTIYHLNYLFIRIIGNVI